MTPFSDQIWWHLARAGGLVALALSGATVLWGLLVATRYLGDRPKPRWMTDVHRFLGGLTVVFTAIHVIALLLDSFIGFSIVDALVPFASAWRPVAVAWGVVAAWLLVAVQASSMFMHRLPRRLWRGIHMTSYATLAAGVVHGFTAGTDAGHLAFRLGVGGSLGAIVFLTAWRILNVRRGRRPSTAAAVVGAGAA